MFLVITYEAGKCSNGFSIKKKVVQTSYWSGRLRERAYIRFSYTAWLTQLREGRNFASMNR